MNLKTFYITLILILLSLNLLCQTRALDSIRTVINQSTNDTVMLENMLNLAEKFESISLDSSILYYYKIIELSEKTKHKKYSVDGYRYLALALNEIGKSNEAFDNMQLALNLANELGNKRLISLTYSNFGIIYRSLGDFENALKMHYKSLQIKEEVGDKKGISASCNNLGVIYQDMANYNEALKFQLRALQIKTELKDKKTLPYTLNNVGLIYHHLNKNDTALSYFDQALKLGTELKNDYIIHFTLDNIVLAQISMKRYSEAETNGLKALQIAKKIGSIKQQTFTLSELAKLYLVQKKFDLAFVYAQQFYSMAKKSKVNSLLPEAAENLSIIYKELGKYELAYYYQVEFKVFNDSIYNAKRSKEINLITLQRKELENSKLIKENLLKQSEIEKSHFFIIGILICVLFLFVLATLIYISRQKQVKAKRLLKMKNNEILEKNEELYQLNEEISAQRDNLEDLTSELQVKNTEITKKNHSITESIVYANRIQSAVLPNVKLFSNLFSEHFILFKPRDIISGDFYFIKQIDNFVLVAAADCTGHGVPGAFMSMLGIAILNEIVRSTEIVSASQVLNELRNQIKASLQQSGQKGEQQDGLDIAFCAINRKTLEMSFAGAHNPCWISRNYELGMRNEELKSSDNQLIIHNSKFIILEADHQPVGIYLKEEPFTEQPFQLQTGDTIYLFSDGYHSQFGGEKKLPMKSKYFKEILSEICILPLENQKQILETKFNEWKGDNEQTDDVLVLGMRI